MLDLNDPAKGGDRLEIAKDVKFANKAIAANAAAGRDISPDAAKPFIAEINRTLMQSCKA